MKTRALYLEMMVVIDVIQMQQGEAGRVCAAAPQMCAEIRQMELGG
jgi:hypothetical protein